jgi:ABC-type hemin transport system ATPase subunit
MLRAGEVRASGRPADVLEPATIRDVFSVDAHVQHTPAGHPWILYGD